MPTDTLSREAIDAMQERLATDGDPTHDDMWVLLDYARSVPARLASAHAEGVREGIAKAAQWCRVQAYCAATRERKAADEQARRAALLVKQTLDHAADVLPALSPPSAEPTGMTADGWIEWKGGECPVPANTLVEWRLRYESKENYAPTTRSAGNLRWSHRKSPHSLDIVAYRIVKPAEPSASVAPDTYETPAHGWTCFHCGETFKQEQQARWHFGATATAKPGCMLRVDPIEERGFLKLFRQEEERAAALEAENAKLREGLRRIAEFTDAASLPAKSHLRPVSDEVLLAEVRGAVAACSFCAAIARALLQGGPK